MEFKERLKELLNEKGVTAYRLAKDTGIDRSYICRWQKGDYMPTVDNLIKLKYYFNKSIDYILGLE